MRPEVRNELIEIIWRSSGTIASSLLPKTELYFLDGTRLGSLQSICNRIYFPPSVVSSSDFRLPSFSSRETFARHRQKFPWWHSPKEIEIGQIGPTLLLLPAHRPLQFEFDNELQQQSVFIFLLLSSSSSQKNLVFIFPLISAAVFISLNLDLIQLSRRLARFLLAGLLSVF